MASRDGKAGPDEPFTFTATVPFEKSGWLAARRMDETGHQTHTAAGFVIINNKPVKASAADADYFIRWIDNILTNTAPGGKWEKYFPTDLSSIRARYMQAKNVYENIFKDSR